MWYVLESSYSSSLAMALAVIYFVAHATEDHNIFREALDHLETVQHNFHPMWYSAASTIRLHCLGGLTTVTGPILTSANPYSTFNKCRLLRPKSLSRIRARNIL